MTREEMAEMLRVEEYPLSSKYDPRWVFENEMGPSALWLAEALCQVPGLAREFDGAVPEHLRPFWDPRECFSFHPPAWWRRHWEQTGLVEIERAEALPGGHRLWLQFEEAREAAGATKRAGDTAMLRADAGRCLGFTRMVARRKEAPQ